MEKIKVKVDWAIKNFSGAVTGDVLVRCSYRYF